MNSCDAITLGSSPTTSQDSNSPFRFAKNMRASNPGIPYALAAAAAINTRMAGSITDVRNQVYCHWKAAEMIPASTKPTAPEKAHQ